MPLVLLRVVIGAVGLVAVLELAAGMHFVIRWMVFLLFPAVRAPTPVFALAAVRVGLDEVLGLPLRALLLVVLVEIRLPTKVLPVVSVDADVTGMLGIAIGTPDGLEVEDIKVCRVVVTAFSHLGISCLAELVE